MFVMCTASIVVWHMSTSNAGRRHSSNIRQARWGPRAEIASLVVLGTVLTHTQQHPTAGLVRSKSPSCAGDSLPPCPPIEDCLLHLPFAARRVFPASLLLAASRSASASARLCKCPPNLVPRPARRPHQCSVRSLSDSPPVTLPPPFLLHDAAQIASHLQPSRAPPPSSVPWSRQALPLSRDSYHIVPLSHLSTTRPRWTTSP